MREPQRGSEHALMEALAADPATYAHFLRLEEVKRERILCAAYDEFLEKGYDKASTNSITQKAGISKGLLFHYFRCKESLFAFLMKDATRRIVSETLPDLPRADTDIFALIKSIIQIKIAICLRHPRETSFMLAAWKTSLPDSLRRELDKMVDLSGNYVDTLVCLLDERLLREGVTKSVAVDIIAWVCEKYTDKMLANGLLTPEAQSWQAIAEDLDAHLDALRFGLYR